MSGLHEYAPAEPPRLDPEPLWLPVSKVPDRPADELDDRRGRRDPANRSRDERDVTGSHVIVIELA